MPTLVPRFRRLNWADVALDAVLNATVQTLVVRRLGH
jgi:hypothetical protein